MTYFTSSDLKNFANLINLQKEVDSEDDEFQNGSSKTVCNPHLMAKEIKTSQSVKIPRESEVLKNPSKDIWEEEEIPDEEEEEAEIKNRPEYEMVYQQNVTSDDVFLQVQFRFLSTEKCITT